MCQSDVFLQGIQIFITQQNFIHVYIVLTIDRVGKK